VKRRRKEKRKTNRLRTRTSRGDCKDEKGDDMSIVCIAIMQVQRTGALCLCLYMYLTMMRVPELERILIV
jgi:hypothetical protein